MSRRKNVLLGCVAVLSFVPLSGEAKVWNAGLQSCADALVGDLERDVGAIGSFRLDDTSSSSRARLAGREVVYLDARDPVSREVIARYDCVINRRAEVLELIEVPLNAADARERSSGLD
jgi:hypothetical protein